MNWQPAKAIRTSWSRAPSSKPPITTPKPRTTIGPAIWASRTWRVVSSFLVAQLISSKRVSIPSLWASCKSKAWNNWISTIWPKLRATSRPARRLRCLSWSRVNCFRKGRWQMRRTNQVKIDSIDGLMKMTRRKTEFDHLKTSRECKRIGIPTRSQQIKMKMKMLWTKVNLKIITKAWKAWWWRSPSSSKSKRRSRTTSSWEWSIELMQSSQWGAFHVP